MKQMQQPAHLDGQRSLQQGATQVVTALRGYAEWSTNADTGQQQIAQTSVNKSALNLRHIVHQQHVSQVASCSIHQGHAVACLIQATARALF